MIRIHISESTVGLYCDACELQRRTHAYRLSFGSLPAAGKDYQRVLLPARAHSSVR